jgi:hypothetical protein
MTDASSTIQTGSPLCFQRMTPPKLSDVVLITGCVALLIIGILASTDSLHFMSNTEAMWLSYGMYGGALLLFIAEIVKITACVKDRPISTTSASTQRDQTESQIESNAPQTTASSTVTQKNPASERRVNVESSEGLNTPTFNPGIYDETSPSLYYPQSLYASAGLIYGSAEKGGNQYAHELIMRQRYRGRNDAICICDKDIPIPTEPIAFAHTCLQRLETEDFNPEILKGLLLKYKNEIKKTPIPKLFIPIDVKPAHGVPHALLLVIEANPSNPSQAKITLINSFGCGGGYKTFEDRLCQIAQEAFPSTKTTVVRSDVRQQNDGWSCGWHMIENIDLLSKQVDVQKFVQNRRLPTRSDKMLKDCYSIYQNYANAERKQFKCDEFADEGQIEFLKEQVLNFAKNDEVFLRHVNAGTKANPDVEKLAQMFAYITSPA